MGVSIGYFSKARVTPDVLQQLLSLAAAANERYEWWCEGIWISDETDTDGAAFGFTKLFCMIDDDDTDTYMAYQDVCEIVRFLTLASNQVETAWRLELEGEAFGELSAKGPDRMLQAHLDSFLSEFPGDFESLRARRRDDILTQWSDR